VRNDGISHSVLSILFDTSTSTATTGLSKKVTDASTAFLDWIAADLKGDKKTASGSKSGVSDPMSNLLRAVDWNNRFTYFGSLTSPPCTTGVQWNILATVLPITTAQLKEIQDMTTTTSSTFYATSTANPIPGNFRKIQKMGGAAASGGQKGYANAVYLTTMAASMLQLTMASTALLVAAAV